MAEKKELIPEMRDSTVSLIYKDKGKRTDIGKYRPIAVNSIIYRIMATTIVVSMGPLLSTVTSANQKAFKPGELLSDNTRQVQDIIKYCEDAQIPGMILFADQDPQPMGTNRQLTLILLDHARVGERVHGPAPHGLAHGDVQKNSRSRSRQEPFGEAVS